MANWTILPNSAVGAGGLPSGATITALRDNPIAIAEGASGAPRVELPAIVDALAAVQLGQLGSYALLQYGAPNDTFPGDTRAGSTLRYTNTNAEVDGTHPIPAGTWRAMGQTRASGQVPRATLWLRIA